MIVPGEQKKLSAVDFKPRGASSRANPDPHAVAAGFGPRRGSDLFNNC